jgi:hypothetical protein
MNDFWEALLGLSIKNPYVLGAKSLVHSSAVGANSDRQRFYAPPRYVQEPVRRRQAPYAPTYQPQAQTPLTVPYASPQPVQKPQQATPNVDPIKKYGLSPDLWKAPSAGQTPQSWGEQTRATIANDQAKRGQAYAQSTGGNYVPRSGQQDEAYMRGVSQGFMNPLK